MCLKEAMELYHPHESQLIDVLDQINLTKSEWNSAFRAILRKPLDYFLQNRKEIFTNFNMKYGFELDEGEIYQSDDYKALNNLVIVFGTLWVKSSAKIMMTSP